MQYLRTFIPLGKMAVLQKKVKLKKLPRKLIFCNRKKREDGKRKLLLISFVCKGVCI